jgi:hypoxanthine phosphoribosyltransferase
MHTIQQVFIGLLLGLAYTKLYIKTDTSLKSILIFYGIILFSTLILTLYVDNIIQNDKIPNWVDKNMYPIIDMKKNVPFYLKYNTVLLGLYHEDVPLYIDYKTLEIYLDKCIDKINNSNIKYDAIVGIKSGGAIISKYIADKLNISNYTVKVTKNTNECGSKNVKMVDQLVDLVSNVKKIYKLCEKIDDNLENKNIILIDEMVHTGFTMEYVIDYLLNDKKVANIFLITITSTNGDIKLKNIQLNRATNYKYALIYPWGYDN